MIIRKLDGMLDTEPTIYIYTGKRPAKRKRQRVWQEQLALRNWGKLKRTDVCNRMLMLQWRLHGEQWL